MFPRALVIYESVRMWEKEREGGGKEEGDIR